MRIDRFGRKGWGGIWAALVVLGAAGCTNRKAMGTPSATETHAGSSSAERSRPGVTLYHCPMHPSYVSDHPGNCPICGMRLVPIEKPEEKAAEGPGVEGRAPFTITARQIQLIGVKTGRVERRPLVKILRTVGEVAYDPDLYRAEAEYVQALRRGGGGEALVSATRLRLRQLGLSDSLIEDLARRGTPDRSLLLPEKTNWVYGEIFEFDLGWVRVGELVRATAPALPNRAFEGRIRSIDPVIDPATRTIRIRAEVDNVGEVLQPDMFLNIEIESDLGTHLAIPESAVLDSGLYALAFVALPGGRFEPRELKLGPLAEGYAQVLSGVSDGETVVTSANFLIDSEAQLKAALSDMSGGGGSMPGMENMPGMQKKPAPGGTGGGR